MIYRILFFGTMMVVVGIVLSSQANAEKYKGALIHSPAEIAEIKPYSNSFGFLYTPGIFAEFEAANEGMNVVVTISGYLRDPVAGVFGDNVDVLVDEVNQHRKAGHDIIFLLDEPAWLTRLECESGKQAACYEVATDYAQTMSNLESAAIQLKSRVSGAKIFHNMAYAEIIYQVRKHGRVDMIQNADLYGFDCYGIMNACGDTKYGYHNQGLYGAHVYNEMMRHENVSPTGRKMLLIAGAYVADGFPNEEAILSQFESYKKYHNQDFVAGTAVFYRSGYRGMDKVEEYLVTEYATWK